MAFNIGFFVPGAVELGGAGADPNAPPNVPETVAIQTNGSPWIPVGTLAAGGDLTSFPLGGHIVNLSAVIHGQPSVFTSDAEIVTVSDDVVAADPGLSAVNQSIVDQAYTFTNTNHPVAILTPGNTPFIFDPLSTITVFPPQGTTPTVLLPNSVSSMTVFPPNPGQTTVFPPQGSTISVLSPNGQQTVLPNINTLTISPPNGGGPTIFPINGHPTVFPPGFDNTVISLASLSSAVITGADGPTLLHDVRSLVASSRSDLSNRLASPDNTATGPQLRHELRIGIEDFVSNVISGSAPVMTDQSVGSLASLHAAPMLNLLMSATHQITG